jgi:hypothetical protein
MSVWRTPVAAAETETVNLARAGAFLEGSRAPFLRALSPALGVETLSHQVLASMKPVGIEPSAERHFPIVRHFHCPTHEILTCARHDSCMVRPTRSRGMRLAA